MSFDGKVAFSPWKKMSESNIYKAIYVDKAACKVGIPNLTELMSLF